MECMSIIIRIIFSRFASPCVLQLHKRISLSFFGRPNISWQKLKVVSSFRFSKKVLKLRTKAGLKHGSFFTMY